jgi:hypothetical protein
MSAHFITWPVSDWNIPKLSYGRSCWSTVMNVLQGWIISAIIDKKGSDEFALKDRMHELQTWHL